MTDTALSPIVDTSTHPMVSACVPIVYIRDVPEELHRRIRVAAATKGKSMRALALRALEREVERTEAEERGRKSDD